MCDLYNGVKLTDLLPEGYAYRRYDGIGTEFSKNSWVPRADAENRTAGRLPGSTTFAVMKCEHAGMDSDGNCPYCGLKIAAAITKPGIFRDIPISMRQFPMRKARKITAAPLPFTMAKSNLDFE